MVSTSCCSKEAFSPTILTEAFDSNYALMFSLDFLDHFVVRLLSLIWRFACHQTLDISPLLRHSPLKVEYQSYKTFKTSSLLDISKSLTGLSSIPFWRREYLPHFCNERVGVVLCSSSAKRIKVDLDPRLPTSLATR